MLAARLQADLRASDLERQSEGETDELAQSMLEMNKALRKAYGGQE
jgi:hypothetical protein